MKAILSAMLVLGFCSIASARDGKADPVGTWKCEYMIGDVKKQSTLVIKKDGDKYAGTMTFGDKQEATLSDVKFKDGDLSFSAERKLGDNKYTVEYKLKVDGDKFKGKGAVEVGGKKDEFDFSGERDKK